MVLWLNVCDKEHLALRNNFRVTKKFLITKFDCTKLVNWANLHQGFWSLKVSLRLWSFKLLMPSNFQSDKDIFQS